MQDLWALLGTAAVVFVATNIDDVLLLAVFFADRTMRPAAVVAGQFLGMAVLIAASAIAALAALVVPPGWPALLGAVPLEMGLWQLVALVRQGDRREDDGADAERRYVGRLRSQLLAVALVTLANGADNLGAYIPIFAAKPAAVPAFAALFLVFTGALCVLGRALVRAPAVGPLLQRVGHVLLPLALIAIGTQILWGVREL